MKIDENKSYEMSIDCEQTRLSYLMNMQGRNFTRKRKGIGLTIQLNSFHYGTQQQKLTNDEDYCFDKQKFNLHNVHRAIQ